LEDRSAAGGAIQTRNFEDYADPSDDSDEEKQPTPPPNLNSGRSMLDWNKGVQLLTLGCRFEASSSSKGTISASYNTCSWNDIQANLKHKYADDKPQY
jgi:hypothetical protein